jgi:hypothetical protein
LTERAFRLPLLVVWTAVVLVLASFLAPRSSAEPQRSGGTVRFDRAEGARILHGIVARRRETWRWQRLMGSQRTHASRSAEEGSQDLAYRRWVLGRWTRRALTARRKAQHPPHMKAWLCIHRYEGAWTDPNPPYYGGLQMDLGFQRTYGPELLRRKGTAEKWTPLEQIWVAVRAHRSGRGFYPWPNTARYCGLI